MMTADVARGKALEVNSAREFKQVDDIERKIEEAVAEGKMFCHVYEYILPAVKNMVEDRGYIVGGNQGMGRDITIEIDWRER